MWKLFFKKKNAFEPYWYFFFHNANLKHSYHAPLLSPWFHFVYFKRAAQFTFSLILIQCSVNVCVCLFVPSPAFLENDQTNHGLDSCCPPLFPHHLKKYKSPHSPVGCVLNNKYCDYLGFLIWVLLSPHFKKLSDLIDARFCFVFWSSLKILLKILIHYREVTLLVGVQVIKVSSELYFKQTGEGWYCNE